MLAGVFASGCAHSRAVPSVTPKAPAASDPVTARISEADAHLAAGLSEADNGHLNRAREEFDRAVDLYLTAPGGAFASVRMAEAYRRSLEAIHLREMEALAAGDGFTETRTEPASIDEVGDLPVAEQPVSAEARARAAETVQGEAFDLPIELNDKVLSCIELYQGRLRDWFEGALSRGQRYLPRIREVLAAEGVPQDLAYVAMVESAFRPAAYSRAKAKGVWQFIAATGKRYGLAQDWWVDERSDPEKATRAAAAYLKELYAMFGDWNLALAGYNAGELVVQRGIERYRTSDFWQLSRTRALRRETRNYVPLIQAAIVVAKAPEKYGIELSPEEAPAFETRPVPGAVDLRVIAECVETPLQELQQLNPELRRLATPANRTFPLKVPQGRAEALGACLDKLPPEKKVQFRTHTVARGQTLASIAQANGVRPRDIADANGLSLQRRLAVGTELIIPIAPRGKTPPVRQAAQTSPPPAKVPPADLAESKPGRISYTIKPGDTLTAIASQYGTTIRDLQAWNGLHGTRIAAGSTLTIYTTTSAKN